MVRLLVIGGSGYVGTRIMRTALARGVNAVSVSRRGTPTTDVAQALAGAEWVAADVEDPEQLANAVSGADAVISCLGAFGSNDFMRRINGEVNAKITAAAKKAGAKQYVYISAAPFGPIEAIVPGYFEGKRAAESAVAEHFGSNGTVLRPGMVYGSRRVSEKVTIPLQLLGAPLETIFGSAPVRALASRMGSLGAPLVPPSPVEDVAAASVAAALGKSDDSDSGDGSGGNSGGGGGETRLLDWDTIRTLSRQLIAAAPPEVTLFWDGGCPLCRREIAYYRRLDEARRVDWVDVFANPQALEAHGISFDEAMRRIHAIDSCGSVQVGMSAFLSVWEQLPYWRALPPIIRALPLAQPVAEKLYTVWARWRLQLTGRAAALGGGSACRKS